jgi:hypothetical protein
VKKGRFDCCLTLDSHSMQSLPMIASCILNVVIFLGGLFMLGPGLYSSIDAIIAGQSQTLSRFFPPGSRS